MASPCGSLCRQKMLSRSCAASTSLRTIATSRVERPAVLNGIWTGRNLASWAARFSVGAVWEEQEICARAGVVAAIEAARAASRSELGFVIKDGSIRFAYYRL